jgi:hypothetical protein
MVREEAGMKQEKSATRPSPARVAFVSVVSTVAVMGVLVPLTVRLARAPKATAATATTPPASGRWKATSWSYFTRDKHLCGSIDPTRDDGLFVVTIFDGTESGIPIARFDERMSESETKEMLEKACDGGLYRK